MADTTAKADDSTEHFGTGAIQSPPDDRDFTFEQLVTASGQELTASLPSTFLMTGLAPILNQGNTPMCVAYCTSGMKGYQDRKDQGKFFNFDEPRFFSLIGGGPNGSTVRVGLDRLLKAGYPVVGVGDPGHHRIAGYYAIPKAQNTLMQAVHDFGPLLVSTPWYHSWFHPVGTGGNVKLPPPDYSVGGHAIQATGYNPTGLVLRNSWGTSWGYHGSVTMPWAYVLHSVWEVWKALDVIDKK